MLTASGVKTISGNNINNLTFTSSGAGYSSVVGIRDQYASTGNIFKNVVHSLSSTGITPTVNGIRFGDSVGTTYNVYNNIVGNLTAPASTGFNLVGIYGGSAGTTYNVSFNTVYLNATSSASGSASSAYYMSSTTPTTNLIDNIFINLSTGTTSWLSTALRRTSTVLTSYGTTSNNNFVYCGTPSATNAIYYDLTNTDQTLSAFKARVTPRETASVSETVSTTPGVFFQSFTGPATGTSTTFLHLVNGLATQIESGGITVSGITDDYDGNTRNATTPDVGADEFSGVAVDLSPPTISYTPLAGTNSTTARTLTATITDASGVPTTGIGLPVLYWKINAGSYTSATAASLGGGQYQFTFGAGVSTGDTVSYYVVAQDSAGTPNVGANPSAGASGFTANPPAASTPPTTPNSYTILTSISGTFTVGAAGTYLTLTAAVNDINTKFLNGPVVLTLLDSSNTTRPNVPDNTGEIFPITINANGGSSATNTITIKPASGVTASISAPLVTAATAILKLNGASWVIIDGSNNGTSSRDLTIQNLNTAATTAAVWVASLGTGAGSTNNIIKNTNIVAGSSTVASTYGIALSGTTIGTAGADNDNNTIQNNTISTVYYGVYANGTAAVSAGGVDSLAITNNVIGPAVSGATNTGFAGIWVQNALTLNITGNTVQNVTTIIGSTGGIYLNSNVNGATVSQNSITNVTSTASSTGTAAITGLYLGNSVFNTTVSRNTITTVASTTSSGYGVRGMIVNTGFSGSNDTIVNNMISDVSNFQDATVTSYATLGINITASGGINVWDNSINLFGDHTGYSSNTTAGVSTDILVNTTGTGLDIRDNILSNTYNNTTSTGDKSYSIYSLSTSASFSSIDYNDYYVAGNGTPVMGSILIGATQTDETTLAAMQASFGGNTRSVAGNPQFNSNTDLHINPAVATLVESGGIAIAGITTDLDGDIRQGSPGYTGSGTAPDIGADEGEFTLVVVNDMQATAFIDPINGGSKLANTAFSPQASFTNNGSATQTNVPVRYRICTDGTCATTLYNHTNTIASIANGVTTTVTFPSTSLSAGNYVIKAKSELVGDQVPAQRRDQRHIYGPKSAERQLYHWRSR